MHCRFHYSHKLQRSTLTPVSIGRAAQHLPPTLWVIFKTISCWVYGADTMSLQVSRSVGITVGAIISNPKVPTLHQVLREQQVSPKVPFVPISGKPNSLTISRSAACLVIP